MSPGVLVQGNAPLVVDIPHAGTHVPPDIARRLTPVARTVPDTDWHVEKLFAFAGDAGASMLVATHSRIAVDLNRDPTGAALYPGADNTELCPTRTFANDAVYADGRGPDADEIAARKDNYYYPYHAMLEAELARVRARHGYAILLDGHSIRSEVPRFFAGRLPDLNLGTADGASCALSVQAVADAVLAGATGFTSVVNGRFRGGYVTRHYGDPMRGVHALQLEIAQVCYMDEAPPFPWDESRAAPLVGVLRLLVEALLGWRR
ncbi:MAG: N-formylglutamate deformylase [Betaproteobacteria bacterium]